jgi:hypothetical protein
MRIRWWTVRVREVDSKAGDIRWKGRMSKRCEKWSFVVVENFDN